MAGGCVWYYPFVLRNNHCKLFGLWSASFCSQVRTSRMHGPTNFRRNRNQTIKTAKKIKESNTLPSHFPIPLQNGIKQSKSRDNPGKCGTLAQSPLPLSPVFHVLTLLFPNRSGHVTRLTQRSESVSCTSISRLTSFT